MSDEVMSEVVDAADDAAFSAGFSEARGENPSADPIDENSTVTPNEDKDQGGESEAQVKEGTIEEQVQQALMFGLPESRIKELLLKAGEVDSISARVEKAFSRYGELNRTIQNMQQRSGGVQLNAAALKRMSGEYPELAEMLASDLNDALSGMGGASQPAFDPSIIETEVQGRIADVRIGLEQDMEKRLLKREHRDWESVVSSDDFKLWRANVLPAEESERLGASWDSEFISDKLTEFKEWKSQAGAKTVTKENKQKRLESAVTPRGDAGGPPALNEDEAFLAGFKNARGA
jgi:hypothetical protein